MFGVMANGIENEIRRQSSYSGQGYWVQFTLMLYLTGKISTY